MFTSLSQVVLTSLDILKSLALGGGATSLQSVELQISLQEMMDMYWELFLIMTDVLLVKSVQYALCDNLSPYLELCISHNVYGLNQSLNLASKKRTDNGVDGIQSSRAVIINLFNAVNTQDKITTTR